MPAAKKSTTTPASAAAKAEAEHAPRTFDYDGHTYTVPHFKKLPLEVLEAEDELTMVRLMVGDEQWALFRGTFRTIEDFQDFTEKVTAQGN